MTRSHSVIDELETDLTNNCDTLLKNKLDGEQNMKQLKEQLKKDKGASTSSIKVSV